MQPAPEQHAARVLVADDSADNRELLLVLLRLWGYEPVEAADGAEAVAVARESPPVAAVLDLAMPRLDGLAAARQLRQMPGLEGLMLVAVSGHGREEYVRLAGEAGFDWFLLKPYDPRELKRCLDEACRPGASMAG